MLWEHCCWSSWALGCCCLSAAARGARRRTPKRRHRPRPRYAPPEGIKTLCLAVTSSVSTRKSSASGHAAGHAWLPEAQQRTNIAWTCRTLCALLEMQSLRKAVPLQCCVPPSAVSVVTWGTVAQCGLLEGLHQVGLSGAADAELQP